MLLGAATAMNLIRDAAILQLQRSNVEVLQSSCARPATASPPAKSPAPTLHKRVGLASARATMLTAGSITSPRSRPTAVIGVGPLAPASWSTYRRQPCRQGRGAGPASGRHHRDVQRRCGGILVKIAEAHLPDPQRGRQRPADLWLDDGADDLQSLPARCSASSRSRSPGRHRTRPSVRPRRRSVAPDRSRRRARPDAADDDAVLGRSKRPRPRSSHHDPGQCLRDRAERCARGGPGRTSALPRCSTPSRNSSTPGFRLSPLNATGSWRPIRCWRRRTVVARGAGPEVPVYDPALPSGARHLGACARPTEVIDIFRAVQHEDVCVSTGLRLRSRIAVPYLGRPE